MPFGIEIVSDVIRCAGSGDYKKFNWIDYGILGVIPRSNEPFVWNNPNTLRSSTPGAYISLTDAWVELQKKSLVMSQQEHYEIAKCSWLRAGERLDERPAADLIVDALSQNIPKSRMVKSILAVDNTFHEFQQEALLKSLHLGGFTDVELIWRPVCIALHHLNLEGRDQFDENDRLVIIDTDSYLPELTVLKLKEDRNELVPIRHLPSTQNPLGTASISYSLKREFIKHISDNRTEVEYQLERGPFAREFFSFLEGKRHNDIWLREGLSYSKFPLNDGWHEEIREYSMEGMSFNKLREMVLGLEDWANTDHILWNGYLCRIQNSNLFTENETIMDELAVCAGAADYAYRRQEGKPTYMDTLPELEIMSAIEGTGRHDFFPLIEGGEIEGGGVKRTPHPRTEFKLEENTTEFTAVLRIGKDQCKKLVTNLEIPPYPSTVPLLIKAEQRPANGHAIVTIEGDEEHQDVFGRRRHIRLDWKSMEDFEYSQYSGPEVYPVEGRIHKDIEARVAIKQIINQNGNMSSYVRYAGQNVRFYKLFEPWGYNSPLGIRLDEPTRGMFGAYYIDDDEVKDLVKRIVLIIKRQELSNRHKHLNQLFIYTPESFLDELRDIFLSDNPQIQSWNTAFAPGRTFSKSEDLELFMDFIIRFSKHIGYPTYPDSSYTRIYFWSYFRALCYYEDTVNVPEYKAEQILRVLSNYVRKRKQEGWRPWQGERGRWEINNIENTKKFCLCVILFSLRFRKRYKTFLQVGSKLNNLMVRAINQDIGQVNYPRTMFQEVRSDTLSDYVYRFLVEKASEEDFGALRGLTTSMA